MGNRFSKLSDELPNQGKVWQYHEEQYVIENIYVTPINEMSRFLGRSPDSIMARRLFIDRNGALPNPTKVTMGEAKYITEDRIREIFKEMLHEAFG